MALHPLLEECSFLFQTAHLSHESIFARHLYPTKAFILIGKCFYCFHKILLHGSSSRKCKFISKSKETVSHFPSALGGT